MQPPKCRRGQEKARLRRNRLMLTQPLCPIRALQGVKTLLPYQGPPFPPHLCGSFQCCQEENDLPLYLGEHHSREPYPLQQLKLGFRMAGVNVPEACHWPWRQKKRDRHDSAVDVRDECSYRHRGTMTGAQC